MLKMYSLYHAMCSLAILACSQSLVESDRHELKIGVLIEQNSNLTAVLHAAVDLAIEKINKDPLTANHFHLDYEIGRMSSCTGQQAIGEFAKLKYTDNVDAIIGPSCNEGCLSAGFLATYFSVPMLSHGCSTSTLSDKAKYPTFGRLRAYASASPKIATKALGRFLESMNWKRIGIVHANLDTWAAASTTIKIDLENQYHIHIPFYKDFIEGHRTSSAEANILAIKTSTVRSKYSKKTTKNGPICLTISSAMVTAKHQMKSEREGVLMGCDHDYEMLFYTSFPPNAKPFVSRSGLESVPFVTWLMGYRTAFQVHFGPWMSHSSPRI